MLKNHFHTHHQLLHEPQDYCWFVTWKVWTNHSRPVSSARKHQKETKRSFQTLEISRNGSEWEKQLRPPTSTDAHQNGHSQRGGKCRLSLGHTSYQIFGPLECGECHHKRLECEWKLLELPCQLDWSSLWTRNLLAWNKPATFNRNKTGDRAKNQAMSTQTSFPSSPTTSPILPPVRSVPRMLPEKQHTHTLNQHGNGCSCVSSRVHDFESLNFNDTFKQWTKNGKFVSNQNWSILWCAAVGAPILPSL